MGEKDLMARVSGRMPDGAYTARWQTAGDDGHVLKGEWTFTIAMEVRAVEPALVPGEFARLDRGSR